MKTTKTITKEVEVVDKIICNKCGENLIVYEIGDHIECEGLVEVEARGGYWSHYIGDNNTYRFSLCERCVVELNKTFKIDAFISGWEGLPSE